VLAVLLLASLLMRLAPQLCCHCLPARQHCLMKALAVAVLFLVNLANIAVLLYHFLPRAASMELRVTDYCMLSAAAMNWITH
jgi:hypothetical protein